MRDEQWLLIAANHGSTSSPLEMYCTSEVAGLFLMKDVESIDGVHIWNVIEQELGAKIDKWTIRPTWHVVHVLPIGHEPPDDWENTICGCPCGDDICRVERFKQRVKEAGGGNECRSAL